jgi:hypothetical protein
MKEEAVETMASSADEQIRILEHLKESSGTLTAMQAADVVKNSLAAKNASIDAANETADQIIEAAWRQKQAGVITEDEYKKIVAAANKARDDSIKAAETTHKRVIEEAKAQAGEHVGLVDWATGEIKNKWDFLFESLKTLFESLRTLWANMGAIYGGYDSDASYGQSGITNGKNSSGWTGATMNTYATGGLPEVGEIFIARESGPEALGRIGSQPAVANNDQIVSAFETAFYRAARAAQSVGNSGSPIQLQVVVGNKTVYDILIDEATRQNIRAGKSVIQVEA